ncbi:MAG: hypothetical protein ACR2PQ_02055 [Myxococcota bacterium]
MARSKIPLPDAMAVESLLASLLDDTIIVQESEKGRAAGDDLVCVYVTDDDQWAAVIRCPVALAACLGGSLGRLPKAATEEAAAAGTLPDSLLANFREVANIGASLLCTDDSPHLRFLEAETASARRAEVRAFEKIVVAHGSFTVDVEGYGSGTLVLAAV